MFRDLTAFDCNVIAAGKWKHTYTHAQADTHKSTHTFICLNVYVSWMMETNKSKSLLRSIFNDAFLKIFKAQYFANQKS